MYSHSTLAKGCRRFRMRYLLLRESWNSSKQWTTGFSPFSKAFTKKILPQITTKTALSLCWTNLKHIRLVWRTKEGFAVTGRENRTERNTVLIRMMPKENRSVNNTSLTLWEHLSKGSFSKIPKQCQISWIVSTPSSQTQLLTLCRNFHKWKLPILSSMSPALTQLFPKSKKDITMPITLKV